MSGHSLDRLVYMANQIAREFASQRPDDPVGATWDHLWHFWDPRMREMILAYDGDGLSETATAAVARLAAPVEPKPRSQATKFNQAGDHEDGRNLMSDAG